MSRDGFHSLNIQPKYFNDVLLGLKNFEVRRNDRDFQVGDILYLRELVDGFYTGRVVKRVIVYILNDDNFCKRGYVVLGLKGVQECFG